ncbi:MAG: hydrogenase iron-sulfur subunit [Thermoflexales bacterium]|nr:hydrogenase iron-sulfur subunit [Thermoflexales bacterium]
MEGECHYLEGNFNARRRVEYVQKLLDQIGLGGQRAQMFNVSSAQGAQFARYCAEFVDKIRSLGLSPLRRAE